MIFVTNEERTNSSQGGPGQTADGVMDDGTPDSSPQAIGAGGEERLGEID